MVVEVKGFGATDVGRKRRRNEDSSLVDPELGLYAVADGMGGHAGGDVASRRAVEVVREYVAERDQVLRDLASESTPERRTAAQRLLEQAIQAACADIYRKANADPNVAGMGTTFVALAVAGDRGVVAHVGDSRLYLARRGSIHCLTEDHTLVQAQIKSGALRPENAERSPFRGVLTRALGQQESVQVDTVVLDILPGDLFLLCSDGLHGYLTDAEIPTLLDAVTPAELPAMLVSLANERGGKDNITAVVVAVANQEAAEPAALLKMNVLQRIPLFQHLSYREQTEILATAQARSYPEGAPMVTEGEPGGDLFVLLEGTAAVERDGLAIAGLAAGGHFGEIGLFDAQPRSATVRALEPVRAMIIPRGDVMYLMQREPTLAVKLLWAFVQSLSQRLRATNTELSEAILSSAASPAGPYSRP